MTKQDMMRQLEKNDVSDLDDLLDLLVKSCHEDGDPNKPIVNKAIIYHHGFVTA